MSEVTDILQSITHGDHEAADRLLEVVYAELRNIAAAKMAQESIGQTLQPTALVHEAWLRLARANGTVHFENRAHFFSAAAEAMRRILVERARRKRAEKHGGSMQRVDWTELDVASPEEPDSILAVSEALQKLSELDRTSAELIKLRFFAGLPNSEAAVLLGLSERTAKRTWAYARSWLLRELRRQS